MITTAALALLLALATAAATVLAVDRRRMAHRTARTERALHEQLASAQMALRSEEQTMEAVRALAGDALAEQSRQLLDLADAKYQTLEQTAEARWSAQGKIVLGRLEQYAQHLSSLERERRDDAGALQHALSTLKEQTAQVQAEAGNLAAALRDNATRGLWGEVQLRRALEASGMLPHADFVEQATVRADKGALRPDVVVHLPNDRSVVIDAKTPLDAFLRASETEAAQQRNEHLAEHGSAVAAHARTLAKRDYAGIVDGSIDFVVLFMPGDPYLSAAVEGRPTLIEDAWADGVLLVTPTTLIGLLRAVALGWRESQVTAQAERIAELDE